MELPAPLSQPLDLVLHVGMRKTGTSSIQFFLRDNREALAARGVLYPRTPGGGRHHRLGLSVKTVPELDRSPEWERLGRPDPLGFRRRFRRRFLTEVEESGLSRVLLSDEDVFGSTFQTLNRLGRWTSRISRSLRLVVYLRRQDDHLVSVYQQEVKLGETRRLADWARQDMSDLYNYHRRLRKHVRFLAPTELEVRRYERDAFPDGSILQDFLDAAGVEARAEDLVQGADRNVGLDAESVEFVRLLNLHRVETESATPGLIDNRELGKRLGGMSEGPALTLPDAVLDEFMARWERPNELVAREFLGEPSGRLFRAPRRTHGTTVEQRLDPGRIADLVRATELSDDLVAPLQALADQGSAPR